MHIIAYLFTFDHVKVKKWLQINLKLTKNNHKQSDKEITVFGMLWFADYSVSMIKNPPFMFATEQTEWVKLEKIKINKN